MKQPPLRFAVFGDCRPRTPRMGPTPEFRRLASVMATGGYGFAVGLGDYIYNQFPRRGGPAMIRRQLAAFMRVVRTLPFPCHLVPGNHDVGEGAFSVTRPDFEKAYRELVSPVTYRSFDAQGSHFILLDSEMRGQEGLIAGAQRAWLLKDLVAARGAANIFVFMHRPVFGYEVFGDGRRIEQSGAFLRRVFKRFGVRAVFVSHIHTCHVTCADGVTQVLTGSAGNMGSFPHFLCVTAEAGGFRAEVIPSNGKSY